jgi:hypothetical protein
VKRADVELARLYRLAAGQAAQVKNLDRASLGVQAHGYPKRLSDLAIMRVADVRFKSRLKTPS